MENKEISKEINEEIRKLQNEFNKKYLNGIPSFFTQGRDYGRMAYLNWRFDKENEFEQFCVMGQAFFEPQYYILWELLNTADINKADGWVFPVVFNTIHGIECYLKGILGALNIYLRFIKGGSKKNDLKFKFESTHEITTFCKNTIEKMEEIAKKDASDYWKNFIDKMKVVQKFVEYRSNNAGSVVAFRYPFTPQSDTYFYNSSLKNRQNSGWKGQQSENITLDIEDYFIWFTKVHDMLNDIYYGVDELLINMG